MIKLYIDKTGLLRVSRSRVRQPFALRAFALRAHVRYPCPMSVCVFEQVQRVRTSLVRCAISFRIASCYALSQSVVHSHSERSLYVLMSVILAQWLYVLTSKLVVHTAVRQGLIAQKGDSQRHVSLKSLIDSYGGIIRIRFMGRSHHLPNALSANVIFLSACFASSPLCIHYVTNRIRNYPLFLSQSFT